MEQALDRIASASPAVTLLQTIYGIGLRTADRERRKIALIATSHALVRAMYAMLRDNQPWRETALPRAVPA